MAEQRDGDGFAETEHAHRDAEDVVFESIMLAAQAELVAIERGRTRAAGGEIDVVREPRVCELVGDDRETGVDQIGRRTGLDEPQHEVLGDRGGRVLGRDARAPFFANAGARYCHVGHATLRGGGGLHAAFCGHAVGDGSVTHSLVFAYFTTVNAFVPSQPLGQAIFIGGGGLHVGTGSPGLFGFGQSTRAIAVHLSPLFITVHRSSYEFTVCAGGGVVVGGGGFDIVVGGACVTCGCCGGGVVSATHAASVVITNGLAKIFRGRRMRGH
jgi:hypothetical protein